MEIVKAAARAIFRARGYFTTSVFGTTMHVEPYSANMWRSLARGEWEPGTQRFLQTVLKPESRYLDIGAWIGPTVLMAAQRCRSVVALEPDVIAFSYLVRNLAMNRIKNVTPLNIALSDHDCMMQMNSPDDIPASSRTSLLPGLGDEVGSRVQCLSFDSFRKMEGDTIFDVIKMDVEGSEFVILPTMKEYLEQYKPILHLSTHAPYLKESDRFNAMKTIADVLDLYPLVLDDNMNVIDRSVLLSPVGTEQFNTFIFCFAHPVESRSS